MMIENRQTLEPKLEAANRNLSPEQCHPMHQWWSLSGSNRRPPACKAGALPAELKPHWVIPDVYRPLTNLVGPGRFELPTSPLSGVRSNQLSYGPELCWRSRRMLRIGCPNEQKTSTPNDWRRPVGLRMPWPDNRAMTSNVVPVRQFIQGRKRNEGGGSPAFTPYTMASQATPKDDPDRQAHERCLYARHRFD